MTFLKRTFITAFIMVMAMVANAQVKSYFGTTPDLKVSGKNLVDPNGRPVSLHGVMDTPNAYFNGDRWSSGLGWPVYNHANAVSQCRAYFTKVFDAITATGKGTYCNLFRLHLDPAWTNDPNKTATNGGGENDISRFSASRLSTYLESLYIPIAQDALAHGLYVIIRPPGVFPEDVTVGDAYNEYLKTVWDLVSKNSWVKAHPGQVMLELGNEPVRMSGNLADYFQPIVNKIRSNGFTGILLLPGTSYQADYRNYKTKAIQDNNFGYAVHNYPGWYGGWNASQTEAQFISTFETQVPVTEKPIVITEVDWSPMKTGSGHWNEEHTQYTEGNFGTWATGTTSGTTSGVKTQTTQNISWGSRFKTLVDKHPNISFTLQGTTTYVDMDAYLKDGTVQPAFITAMKTDGYPNADQACSGACFQWYKTWAGGDYVPMPLSGGSTGGNTGGTTVTGSKSLSDIPFYNYDSATPRLVDVAPKYNEAIDGGAEIYGVNGNVYYKEYADLTGYKKMVIKGSGGTLRVLFNRLTDGGTTTELNPSLASGEATIDLTNVDANSFVHLHSIKNAWGDTKATITSITLYGEEAGIGSNVSINKDMTWDFSEFTTQVTLKEDNNEYAYNGLTLVGGTGTDNEYVKSTSGFHANGGSSATSRYIKLTPATNGKLTVNFKSNNTTDNSRTTAIGTAVGSPIVSADCSVGTVAATLTAGTTYYVYFVSGGQSITKLTFEKGKTADNPTTPTVSEPSVTPVAYTSERLNRAPVAVKTKDGYLVSWRSLESDAANLTFSVSRNGTQIATGLTKTNYLDASGKVGDTYKVTTSAGESSEVKAWGNMYTSIELARPSSIKSGNTTGRYRPDDISVGDLDGDGNYELVVKWLPDNARDNSQEGYTSPTLYSAHKMDGTALWTKNINLGLNLRSGNHYSQFLVYDFDGDGKAEVICKTAPGSTDGQGNYVTAAATDNNIKSVDNSKTYVNSSGHVTGGEEFLTVFNGKTGAAMHTIWYNPPRSAKVGETGATTYGGWESVIGKGANYNRGERYTAAVAHLDGANYRPSAILERGYYTYTFLWAVDWNGTALSTRWVHFGDAASSWKAYNASNAVYASGTGKSSFGQGVHGISVGDVNNDGKDEIVIGGATIGSNGKLLCSTGVGHGDAIHLTDLVPSRQGLEIMMPHEESPFGYDVHDATNGTLLASATGSADNGRGIAGDFIPSNPGSEFWSSQFSDVYSCADGTSVGTSKGDTNYRIYWTGDPYDQTFDGHYNSGPCAPSIKAYNKTTGKFSTVQEFASYGNPATCNTTKATPCLQADLFGDWREELIMTEYEADWSASTCKLLIYSTPQPTDYKVTCLMQDHVYRMGVAWQNSAYNQPPHLGYSLADKLGVNGSTYTMTLTSAAPSTEVDVPSADDSSHTINYNIATGTTATALSSTQIVNDANITATAGIAATTADAAGKTNLTVKITSSATAAATVGFTVKSGYQFTPSAISVKVQPVGDSSTKTDETNSVRLVLSDGTTSIESSTSALEGVITTCTLPNSSNKAFTGNVTLSIYCSGDCAKYRLGTPISIDGTSAVKVADPDPEPDPTPGLVGPTADDRMYYDAATKRYYFFEPNSSAFMFNDWNGMLASKADKFTITCGESTIGYRLDIYVKDPSGNAITTHYTQPWGDAATETNIVIGEAAKGTRSETPVGTKTYDMQAILADVLATNPNCTIQGIRINTVVAYGSSDSAHEGKYYVTITDMQMTELANAPVTEPTDGESITLTAGNSYTATADKTYSKSVTLQKTFAKAGIWYAFYAPIIINVEAYKGKLEFAEVENYRPTEDTNGDGKIDDNDQLKLVVTPIRTGNTKANTPYLVRPKQSGTISMESVDKKTYKATENTETHGSYMFKGTYSNVEATTSNNYYYVSERGTLSHRTGGTTLIPPYSWYMYK